MVELLVANEKVVGSSPISRSSRFSVRFDAEWSSPVSSFGSYPKGRRFKSYLRNQTFIQTKIHSGVLAQLGERHAGSV